MNALEAASLVMIPSGYEDGTLGSLKPTDGTGDFTFTRGSNISATRVNADGNIEKGYENLLLQSNSFTTTWLQTDLTATSGQSGYDGSNDAWLLSKSAANGRIRQYVTDTGIQTLSAYFKAGTNNWMRITYGGATTYFDLANGVLGSDNSIDATITSIGSGWYRCTFTANVTSAQYAQFYVADANGDTSGTTGSILIQDAMLNQGMVAYPYVETTTAPVAGGILEDMPRLDYSNGSCPSLLLEPSRTNLIPNSEYFMALSWASKTGFTTEENTKETLSPEGYYNATKFIATTTDPVIFDFVNVDVLPYTFTFYAKGKGSTIGKQIKTRFLYLASATGQNQEDIFTLTSDWQRFEAKTTPTGAGDLLVRIDFPAETAVVGDEGYLYGAQFEQGSYPSSYIPTYGVSQTRLADVLFEGAAGLSNFFNPTEGTLFFEVDEPLFRQLTTDGRSIAMRDTTNGEYFQLRGRSNSVYFLLTMCSPSVVVTTNFQNNTKYVMRWNGSEVKIFANGEARGSATQIDSFRPNTLGVASGFGMYTPTGEKFTNITCFPTALSDEACIELTTI